jgi:diguanylate cyclase (GGDEF)-like protein
VGTEDETDLVTPGPPPVLVLTPSTARAAQLGAELGARGRRCVTAPDAAAAWPLIAAQRPAAAVSERPADGSGNDSGDLSGNDSGDGPDGELVAVIRALAMDASPAPVLVATPSTDHTTHLALLDAGAAAIMATGTPAAQVADAVDRELTAPTAQPFRVTAVDDDPDVLEALQVTLQAQGIALTPLRDPTRLLGSLPEDPPDLVMLDIDMPKLNGVDLCRLIRANPRWRTLPVLFLSARRDAQTITRVFRAGADDYISKPIVGPEVISRVRARLERARLHQLLSETDPLTGLANRRRLEEQVGRLLSLSRRLKQPLSLAVLDVDHFKRVNDEHGHATGDAVLRQLAAHLTRSFRTDTAIARIGGEEFVLALLGTSPAQCGPRLTAVLTEFFRDGVEVGTGTRLHVSVSAGLAYNAAGSADFRELYRRADEALLQAKQAGRNRVLIAEMDVVPSI